MPIPQRATVPTRVSQLEWLITDDGSRTLRNTSLNESYHSGCGAVAESWWVYVHNSGVASRLAAGKPTRVIEYGLGTGTTMLLTAALAEHFQAKLEYSAFEAQLLPAEIFGELPIQPAAEMLARALAGPERQPTATEWTPGEWLRTLAALQLRFVSQIRALEESCDAKQASVQLDLSKHVTLRMWLGDAAAADQQALCDACFGRASFDAHAIYFDPFSPETNPTLWAQPVLQSTFDLLAPGGTLTSYCVKSEVRRRLQDIGFSVERLPGPPQGKRQVLLARKPTDR